MVYYYSTANCTEEDVFLAYLRRFRDLAVVIHMGEVRIKPVNGGILQAETYLFLLKRKRFFFLSKRFIAERFFLCIILLSVVNHIA